MPLTWNFSPLRLILGLAEPAACLCSVAGPDYQLTTPGLTAFDLTTAFSTQPLTPPPADSS